MNKIIASATPVKEINFSLIPAAGPFGPSSGFRMQSQKTVVRKSAVRKIPGKMQAINSWVIDCSVWTAMMMRTTLGGMTTPSVPPMATLPVLRAGW